MKKSYSAVFLSITFLFGTSYAQERHLEIGPESTLSPLQLGFEEIQTDGKSNHSEPLVLAPNRPVPASPALVVELPPSDETTPVLPQQVQSATATLYEAAGVKPVVETVRVLALEKEGPSRLSDSAVTSERRFELEGVRKYELLQSTSKRQVVRQGSGESLSLETTKQVASPVVETRVVETPVVGAPIELSIAQPKTLVKTPKLVTETLQTLAPPSTVEEVKVPFDSRPQIVVKYPTEDLKVETSTQIAAPPVQQTTELADVETQVLIDVPQDSFKKMESPFKATQVLAQPPQALPETRLPREESAEALGFDSPNSSEREFGMLPTPAVTSVEQTTPGVVATQDVVVKQADAVKQQVFAKQDFAARQDVATKQGVVTTGAASAVTLVKKPRRSTEQSRKKAAAGWWMLLPLLLLPLLAWFVVGVFGKRERKQEEAMRASDARRTSNVSVSSGATATTSNREKVSTDNSLEFEASTSRSVEFEASTSRSGKAYASGAATTRASITPATPEKPVAADDIKVVKFEKAASAVEVNSTQLESSVNQKIVSKSPVGHSEPVVADDVQSRDGFVAVGSPEGDTVETAAQEVKFDSLVEADSTKVDEVSTTAAITAGADRTGTALPAANGHSEATETSASNVAGGFGSGSRDDLTQIEGINAEAQQIFYKAGYYRFSDIQNANPEDLKRVFSNGDYRLTITDFKTWSSLAALRSSDQDVSQNDRQACEGTNDESACGDEWTQKATAISEKLETYSVQGGDDLTKIKGIGAATASLLRQSGITTFSGLRGTSSDRLQAILYKGGLKFKLVDPSTWTEQARFATTGDWAGLSAFQATQCVADENRSTAIESDVTEDSASSGKQFAGTASRATSTTKDDLTKIKGCGQASKRILNENGIYSFAQVASMTSQQLGKLFAELPKRFQLINTSTWPAQAREFAGTGTQQQGGSVTFEMELLDEIDEIQEIASTSTVSSTTPRREKAASKRDK